MTVNTKATEDFVDHPLRESQEAIQLLLSIGERSRGLPSRLTPHFPSGSGMWTTDFLVFAAAKRTMSLSEGFLTMMRQSNFGVAAALLRMQLDTSLRFSGLMHVKNRQEYARRVLQGEHISKMKSASGVKLTDKFLSEELSKQLPWVRKVYEVTSGFIHLSDRHIFQTFGSVQEKDRTVYLSISPEDVKRPPSAYLEILEAFDASTQLACHLLETWVATRPRPSPPSPSPTPSSYS